MPSSMNDIHDFLALRRIALVGVSRDPKDFSRVLFREMCDKGYDMIPVNPAVGELESRQCFARVQRIEPPAEGVLIITRPQDTEGVARDCVEAGIRHVWMHRSGGQGSVSRDAVNLCRMQGIHLVEGYCPFMFFPQAPVFHRVHGFFLKLTGAYPRQAQSVAQ